MSAQVTPRALYEALRAAGVLALSDTWDQIAAPDGVYGHVKRGIERASGLLGAHDARVFSDGSCAVCGVPEGHAHSAVSHADGEALGVFEPGGTCLCGSDDCAGPSDAEHHQCGGPQEACGVSGCDECRSAMRGAAPKVLAGRVPARGVSNSALDTLGGPTGTGPRLTAQRANEDCDSSPARPPARPGLIGAAPGAAEGRLGAGRHRAAPRIVTMVLAAAREYLTRHPEDLPDLLSMPTRGILEEHVANVIAEEALNARLLEITGKARAI